MPELLRDDHHYPVRRREEGSTPEEESHDCQPNLDNHPMSMYEVRCLKSLEAVESVEEDWRKLYESNHCLYHFQSFDWNHSLLRHRAVHGAIRMWILYREGQPVIIAPLMRVRQGPVWELVFLGHNTHADYLDFVYNHLNIEDFGFLVGQIIARSPECVVTFASMNEGSRAASLLGMLGRHHRVTTEPCLGIRLPASIDAYVSSLGKSTRKEIRAGLNRLAREHPGHRYAYSSGSQLPSTLVDTILRVYRERLEYKCLPFAFPESYTEFLRDYISASRDIFLAGLYIDDQLAAFNLGFIERNRDIQVMTVSMDSEYRQLNVGNLLLYNTICHLIRGNENDGAPVAFYDLTRGDELYKRKYGGTLHRTISYSYARFGMVDHLLRLVMRSRRIKDRFRLFWRGVTK